MTYGKEYNSSSSQPNDESNDHLSRLKIQNILFALTIIAVIVAISINRKIIKYLEENQQIPASEQEEIIKKGRALSWFFLLVTLFVLYSAYQDYKVKKSTGNFLLLVGSVIFVIANIVRLIGLYQPSVSPEEAADFI